MTSRNIIALTALSLAISATASAEDAIPDILSAGFSSCEYSAYELADSLQSVDASADWQVMPVVLSGSRDAEATLQYTGGAGSEFDVSVMAPSWKSVSDFLQLADSTQTDRYAKSRATLGDTGGYELTIGEATCEQSEASDTRSEGVNVDTLDECTAGEFTFQYTRIDLDDATGRKLSTTASDASVFMVVTVDDGEKGDEIGCAVIDLAL